jgi:single-stranded-DNA-specific exonuclease
VAEFRERLRAHASGLLTPADFERELAVDSEIALEEIGNRSVDEILRLAPFGFGNPSPVFALRGVEVAGTEIFKEKHAFVRFKLNGRTVRAKGWNFAERVGEVGAGALVDMAVQFEEDDYSAARGYAPWQVVLKDVK